MQVPARGAINAACSDFFLVQAALGIASRLGGPAVRTRGNAADGETVGLVFLNFFFLVHNWMVLPKILEGCRRIKRQGWVKTEL